MRALRLILAAALVVPATASAQAVSGRVAVLYESSPRPRSSSSGRPFRGRRRASIVPDIYAFLAAQGIPYDRHDHPAVFTVEESERLLPEMGGAATKNLFLRDEKGRRQFLVSVAAAKRVDLRALAAVLQSTKLSFGSADRLARVLGVEPGSVTLLALANDPSHQVEVFLDRDLWDAAALRCHPLVNTATLVIPHGGLERFFQATGHPAKIVSIPERPDA